MSFQRDPSARRTLLLALALASAAPAAADDTDRFLYQPDRVPVGRVFHYVKSNLDGSEPEQVALYVAARDRIEAFKYHRGGTRAGRVIAWLDWTSCTVRRLESWQVPIDGEPVLFAIATAGAEGRSVDVALPGLGKPAERVTLGWRPWHVYNFDLASLNVAMAHLVDPRDTVTIGLADPTFADDGPTFRYRGEATLTYAGEETRGRERCRVYRIDGPGLDGRGGTIWSRVRDGFFQDVEIALPDNPAWTSFKLKLERVGRMSAKQWERFVREAPK